jgi:hypothetical protein
MREKYERSESAKQRAHMRVLTGGAASEIDAQAKLLLAPHITPDHPTL